MRLWKVPHLRRASLDKNQQLCRVILIGSLLMSERVLILPSHLCIRKENMIRINVMTPEMKSAICSRAWRLANPDRARAATKAWKKANADRVRLNNKAYRLANPDKVRGYNKKWNKNNLDFLNAKSRAWKKKNPEKVRLILLRWKQEHIVQA